MLPETTRQKVQRFRAWSGWRVIDYYLVRISIVLCVITGYLYFQETTARREYVDHAFCSIISKIKPGYGPIDQARKDFRCGPYKAPPIVHLDKPPPKPKKTPGIHRSTPALQVTPQPRAAPGSPSPTPRPSTTTVHVTPPPRTVTISPKPTSSPPSSPQSPKPTGIIASVCNLPLINGVCSL